MPDSPKRTRITAKQLVELVAQLAQSADEAGRDGAFHRRVVEMTGSKNMKPVAIRSALVESVRADGGAAGKSVVRMVSGSEYPVFGDPRTVAAELGFDWIGGE